MEASERVNAMLKAARDHRLTYKQLTRKIVN